MNPWFPRPKTVSAIEPVLAGRGRSRDLFELLVDPAAQEWRHKVGVAGRREGSAKPTTRLLACGGFVAKTRVDQAGADRRVVLDQLESTRAVGTTLEVWHPSKEWFLVHADGLWYPVTLCRELCTLRTLPDLEARLAGWLRMLELTVHVWIQHDVGLDLNPSNFAEEHGGSRLYYLDDEFYQTLGESDLANAIVSRLPEEPEVPESRWARWMAELHRALRSLEGNPLSWSALADELGRYPIPEAYYSRRAALERQLHDLRRPSARRGRRRGAARRTCVFADVHANLPALEAVLDAAGAAGADSYLFLGDVVGYGPHPRQCIDRLAQLQSATLLRGNHDHAIATMRLDAGMNRLARRCAEWTLGVVTAEDRAWLGGLPVEAGDAGWMAVHGAPRDPHRFFAYVYDLTYEDNLAYLKDHGIGLCFYGHTHVQLAHVEDPVAPTKLTGVDTIEPDRYRIVLANPGSVGQPRDGDARACFAMWERSSNRLTFHRTSYDVEKTALAIRQAELPSDLVTRLQGGR